MARLQYLSLFLVAMVMPGAVARLARAEIENGMSVTSAETPFEFLRSRPEVIVGTRTSPMPSRELYGAQWSWSNLFFHLGICKADNCHKGPGPCGCPDCSKPHKKHFQNGYCDSYDSAYYADGSDGSDKSSSFYDDGSTSGTGPTATRSSYLWWIVGGVGAAAAAAGAAFAMKKRTAAGFTTKSKGAAAAAKGGSSSNYMLMGAAGVGAAIAGAMSKLGLKTYDDSSSTSGSSGIVSKRMGLMQEAEELPRISDDASEAPSFIEIHSCHSGIGDETYMEAPDGMEVQGPYRPSSNYGV